MLAQRALNALETIANSEAVSARDFHIKGAAIRYDSSDYKGVVRAAGDLQADIFAVLGRKPELTATTTAGRGEFIIGTLGKSRLIDGLVASGKLKADKLKGRLESFVVATIDGNLVIAGSDKRGTIYGIYELSQQLGVSPWYWWADAPIAKRSDAFVRAGYYQSEEPKVKYRGIFINDEWPSFGGWATEKFGGVNSKMYCRLFELLLRLRANFLWPAMWSSAFNEDDPLSPKLADEYGIIMGTSHHEPMMRAHKEYTSRRKDIGPWNWRTNKDRIAQFFREGMERNKDYENIVTIGMRGDGDAAMSENGDEASIKVLADVVAGQRQIIKDVCGKAPAEVPQLWAIFTEVQRYYDAGFTVPDDVLLLFCDNNWGYIRRTGPAKEQGRKGGMGLYYHIDMNGGPWNDRWVNTTTPEKLHEQLSLAYQTGIDDLWIVNVGDIKPKEMPIDFIMRYAWNPDAITPADTRAYLQDWAASIFGSQYSAEIADIVAKYSKYNLIRKPEVQLPDVFSFVNYHEADSVQARWETLTREAEAIGKKLPAQTQDAYYQLVLYPTLASAAVAQIYLNAGRSQLYERQGRKSANDYAARARELFETDWQLTSRYNDSIAGGKWKNMMQDKHIGYTKWEMPKDNILPELGSVRPLGTPCLGVAVEGSEKAWPLMTDSLTLPTFDRLTRTTYYIDVFNRGVGSLDFSANSPQSWIKLDKTQGTVAGECRLNITIDWEKAPAGRSEGVIEIAAGREKIKVRVPAVGGELPRSKEPFFGGLSDEEFGIPAWQFTSNAKGRKGASWTFLPGLGRDKGDMAITPRNTPSTPNTNDAARLGYKLYLPTVGKHTIAIGILPTGDVNPARGLRLAVGLDKQKPQTLDARQGFHDEFAEYTPDNLRRSKGGLRPLPEKSKLAIAGGKYMRHEVFDNIRWIEAEIDAEKPGFHTLYIYMVDPEVVVEKIIVNPDDEHVSYFGNK